MLFSSNGRFANGGADAVFRPPAKCNWRFYPIAYQASLFPGDAARPPPAMCKFLESRGDRRHDPAAGRQRLQ
jgi:hypothetical protein